MQFSKTKASIINLLFNYGNALFAILNGIIFVPLYLKYFSVGTYGSYLSSGNIIVMLGLLEGGMSFVLTQKLSSCYGKKDFNEFSKILGTGLAISMAIFIFLVCLGLILSPFISSWVKSEPTEYKNIQYAFILSTIGAGLNILFHNLSALFQAILKVQVSGLVNLLSILVGIFTTLLSLEYGYGVVGISLGVFFRGLFGVFMLLLSMIKIFKKEKIPRIQFCRENLNQLVSSILPMFGGSVAKSLISSSQLLIITTFINPTASAVFFITGRVYQVCDSLLAPVGSSIFSSISQMSIEKNNYQLKNKIVKIFLVFNIFSLFLLSSSFLLNSSFISLLLGEDKFGGDLLSFFICINMLFYTRFNFISVNLFALGVFGKTIMYDVIGGMIRLIIIFLLIGHIGYYALPIAEFFTTVSILGYFLNKLILDKLELNGREIINFIFSGVRALIIILILMFLWKLILPIFKNWISFILILAAISLINGVILVFFFKDVRDLIKIIFFKKNILIKNKAF
jgi:O-antigen/teichoic acid export membrane protein